MTNVVRHTLLPIVNNCFVNSLFPTELKFADITPVFKKEDNLSKKNYTAVSVLVCQLKLNENIISDQLMEHFKDNLASYLCADKGN